MSPAARVLGALRLRAGAAARRLREKDSYVHCEQDSFWFRPLYTDGKCPVCGSETAGEAPRLPLLVRIDRFRLGMAVLGLVSVGMCALVLVMYFRR